MLNTTLENQLILIDIADVMADYVSLQLDIDDTKVKAAAIIAQNIDIKRLIGNTNLQRCINPSTSEDNALRDLIVAPLCYFTYSRLIKSFQGTFTDSGYITESESVDRNIAKSTANEMSTIAETLMEEVITFLEAEDSNDTKVKGEDINPRIRVFGGEENRASN